MMLVYRKTANFVIVSWEEESLTYIFPNKHMYKNILLCTLAIFPREFGSALEAKRGKIVIKYKSSAFIPRRAALMSLQHI